MLRVEVASEARGGMASAAVRRIISHVIARPQPKQSRSRKNNPRGDRPGLLPPDSVGTRNDPSISVAFIGPKRMRELNKTYHGEDRVTDVLAFPQASGVSAQMPAALGEILICPSYVRAQAKRAGEPFRREITRVLVHGTLHLLGYDHTTPEEAERMFGLQEQIVKTLKSKP